MRFLLLGAVAACIVAACGSENRGISESTPPNPIAPSAPAPAPPPTSPTVPGPIVVHNTLSPAGDRNILDLYGSSKPISYISMVSGLLPTMLDDFTSPVTAAIRTVSWQGAHCRWGAAAISVGSKSFHIGFFRDRNGRPDYLGPLYNVTLEPGETQERFAFEVVLSRDESCYYYDYTAVLPRSFSVTGGTRYWLGISAHSDESGWAWRAGQPDNDTSARESRLQIFMLTQDLAFSFSSE